MDKLKACPRRFDCGEDCQNCERMVGIKHEHYDIGDYSRLISQDYRDKEDGNRRTDGKGEK